MVPAAHGSPFFLHANIKACWKASSFCSFFFYMSQLAYEIRGIKICQRIDEQIFEL